MSEQIKEALDALGPPKDGMKAMLPSEDRVIRSALEAAQQEADAWEAINSWCSASGPEGPEREAMCECSGIHGNGGKWRVSLNHDFEQVFASSNLSRLKALTEAAAWCRAELAK